MAGTTGTSGRTESRGGARCPCGRRPRRAAASPGPCSPPRRPGDSLSTTFISAMTRTVLFRSGHYIEPVRAFPARPGAEAAGVVAATEADVTEPAPLRAANGRVSIRGSTGSVGGPRVGARLGELGRGAPGAG